MILVERRRGFLMGAVWIIFIPFLVIIYASTEKKIKRLNKRIRRLEKQVKGNQDMSRLLEDWVKLTRVNHKQQRETKLVRIEDIQGIQL